MIIEKVFKNGKVYNLDLYNELLRVNKNLIPRWNIKVTLDKFYKLQKIDCIYNAYFFIDNGKKIGFGLISDEDGEDINCSNIKKQFQLDNKNNYWLANFFIYPDFREKGYGNKCFLKLLDITKNKDFYLYTDKNNFIARKIYSKFMEKIGIYENKKIIYLRKSNEK